MPITDENDKQSSVAWLSKETIEVLKSNFSYVAVLALCFVVIKLSASYDELRKESSAADARRIRELREDVVFWQRAFYDTKDSRLIRDTVYISNSNR